MARLLRAEKGAALTFGELDNNFKFHAAMVGSGLHTGGGLVATLGTTAFTIEAGNGIVVDNTDPLNPDYIPVTWGQFVGEAIGSGDATFVAIDRNGLVVKSDTPFTESQFKTLVTLGSVNHVAGTIDSLSEFTTMRPFDLATQLTGLMDAIGVVNLDGNRFSGVTGTMKIEVTAGNTFFFGITRSGNTKSVPQLDSPTFVSTWRNGAGGWHTETGTDIFAGRFDNNTVGPYVNGPNGSVLNNRWTIIRFQRSPDSGLVVATYGQQDYGSSEAALLAVRDEPFDVNPAAALLPFRAIAVVRGGATNADNPADVMWRSATNVGGEF